MNIKTASDLKYYVEQSGNEPHFFTRSSMRFFVDTMRNYGVRKTTVITLQNEAIDCWELYRRHAVKHNLTASSYFNCRTFQRVFSNKGN